MSLRNAAAVATLAALLSGCAALASKPKPAPPVKVNQNPYASTYERYPGALTVIRHATVWVDSQNPKA